VICHYFDCHHIACHSSVVLLKFSGLIYHLISSPCSLFLLISFHIVINCLKIVAFVDARPPPISRISVIDIVRGAISTVCFIKTIIIYLQFTHKSISNYKKIRVDIYDKKRQQQQTQTATYTVTSRSRT
jgi:hypothetical protein